MTVVLIFFPLSFIAFAACICFDTPAVSFMLTKMSSVNTLCFRHLENAPAMKHFVEKWSFINVAIEKFKLDIVHVVIMRISFKWRAVECKHKSCWKCCAGSTFTVWHCLTLKKKKK